MVIPKAQAERAMRFAMLVIALAAIGGMLVGVLYWTTAATGGAPPARKIYLTRVAYLAGGLLILTVFLLGAVVVRHLASRAAPPQERPPTEHVNAWVEAGRRLKAKHAPPVMPYEDRNTDRPPK